jgi:hypothetical protein
VALHVKAALNVLKLIPSDFNLGDFAAWPGRADPWRDIFASRQSLDDADRLLNSLCASAEHDDHTMLH